MPRNSASLIFLSLFAPVERAAEIEGDLKEEAVSRGKIWYARQLLLTILALFKQAMVKDTFIVFLLTLSVLQLMLGVDRQIVDPIRFWVWDRLGDTQTLMAFGINYLSWVVTGFLWGAMLVLCLGKYGVRTLIMSVFIIIVKVIFDWGAAAPVISALQVLVFVLMPFLMGGLLIHAKAVSKALARPVERQAR